MPSSLHTDEYRIFRAMLTQARLASGMTQTEVARKLGKPQSYVSKYENGERRLDVTEFVRLADILGVDAAAFLVEYMAAAGPPRAARGRRRQ